MSKVALSKNQVIYPPRRAQSTQSFRTVSILADFPDGSAFSMCSAVKFKDIVISLENSTVPSKVLIMIPCYNAERFIHRSIKSFLIQTRKTELWIVDNCSTDATQTIVKEYQEKHRNIKLIVNEKNLGRIGNMNRCLDLFESSDYEYLKYLFAGDELVPHFVETIEDIVNQHPDLIDIEFPYYFHPESGKESVSKVFPESRILAPQDHIKERIFPIGFYGGLICSVFSKKSVLNNRVDEGFIGVLSFYNRFALKGNSYYYGKPLTRLYVEARGHFKRALNFDIRMETAYMAASSLENNKNNPLIQKSDYKAIKEIIVSNLISNEIPYLSPFYTLSLSWTLLYKGFLKRIYYSLRYYIKNTIKRVIRRKEV